MMYVRPNLMKLHGSLASGLLVRPPGACWSDSPRSISKAVLNSRALGQDPGCDSALGCLLGLAVGDSVGAPLEFCAVDENQDSSSKLSRR